MPTESTFLLAGLLFLAAALGYFFAVFGDDEEGDVPLPASRLNADYIKGLNFLLNEQPDQALEVFMRMVAVDDETLETHFALGSLFRRRGEVDRAIRIHQNLIARPNLSDTHREHAVVSLAEDYFSAGLFDRAETLFQELRASPEFRQRALEKLVRIYEVTQDWEPAIEAYAELQKLKPVTEETDRIAHYYCELAEEAVRGGNFAGGRELLQKAAERKPGTVRSRLALAAIAQQTEEHEEAIGILREIIDTHPSLVGVIVPMLAASCRALDAQAALSETLEELRTRGPEVSRAIALATIYDPQIVNSTALQCLRDFVLEDPILSNLVPVDELRNGDFDQTAAVLQRIREGLSRLFPPGHRYSCSECGYTTSQLTWQCPSCRSWESVAPAVRFSFASKAK